MKLKRYVYKTLGFLGQMYEEDGETEANHLPNGSIFILASDYDAICPCIVCGNGPHEFKTFDHLPPHTYSPK